MSANELIRNAVDEMPEGISFDEAPEELEILAATQRADEAADALRSRSATTPQYKPDAPASACIVRLAMECTRWRVGLVLAHCHWPSTIETPHDLWSLGKRN